MMTKTLEATEKIPVITRLGRDLPAVSMQRGA